MGKKEITPNKKHTGRPNTPFLENTSNLGKFEKPVEPVIKDLLL
jgi:hypothetical protein